MKELIKYMDFFCTKLTFYNDKNKKYYTFLGGVLSILCVIISLIIFFTLTIEDFKREFPTILFSSNIPQKNTTINLKKEKIFIPFRIVDNNNNFINNTNFVYPVINYYDKKRFLNETITLESKKVNYKLCNETFIKKLIDEKYSIELPLNQFYCIDSKDIEIEESWISLLINYTEINLYLCENYNEKNEYYSPDNINLSQLGNNNSLEIEFYVPEVYFDPQNLKNPISIIYKQYYYHISKFKNQIHRFFLDKFILFDDLDLFGHSPKEYTYWGTKKFVEDLYNIPLEYDIINKENNTIVYAINFYFEPIIIKYFRRYKKLHIILSEGLPIIYMFFAFMKFIAKFIKRSEENRKLLELLFENLVIKENRSQEVSNNNNIKKESDYNSSVKRNSNEINRNSQIMAISQIQKIDYIQPKESTIIFKPNNNNENEIMNQQIADNSNSPIFNYNACIPLKKISKKSLFNNDSNIIQINPFRKESGFSSIKNSNIIINSNRYQFKSNLKRTKFRYSNPFSDNKKNVKIVESEKLFPYKYYFFLMFFKNINFKRRMLCFPKKFIKANLFLGQLLDISSYLLLHKEFQILKNLFLTKEEINYIEKENRNKININNEVFMQNVEECIEKQKFYILANRRIDTF